MTFQVTADNVVIAAEAVITGDPRSGEIYAGVPAQQIREIGPGVAVQR